MSNSQDSNSHSIIPEPDNFYHNILENLYVMGNKANYDWLMESKAQLGSGKIHPKITEPTANFAYCKEKTHML